MKQLIHGDYVLIKNPSKAGIFIDYDTSGDYVRVAVEMSGGGMHAGYYRCSEVVQASDNPGLSEQFIKLFFKLYPLEENEMATPLSKGDLIAVWNHDKEGDMQVKTFVCFYGKRIVAANLGVLGRAVPTTTWDCCAKVGHPEPDFSEFEMKLADYTGCDPDIAKMLQAGRWPKCECWDSKAASFRHEDYVVAYTAGTPLPYRTIRSAYLCASPIKTKPEPVEITLRFEDGIPAEVAEAIAKYKKG